MTAKCTCPTSNIGLPHKPYCDLAQQMRHEYDALMRKGGELTDDGKHALANLRQTLVYIGLIIESDAF